MASTLGEANHFRYKGYYYDSETGLYYLNSRYYNPEWGRFISADSVLGKTGGLLSHNLFAYCVNNPVMKSDPSGRSDWWEDLQKAIMDSLNWSKDALEDTWDWTLNAANDANSWLINDSEEWISKAANDAYNWLKDDSLNWHVNAGKDALKFVGDIVNHPKFADTAMAVGGVALGGLEITAGCIAVAVPEPTTATKWGGAALIAGGIYQIGASIIQLKNIWGENNK